jgi:tetratricopeptide (TPR) repeat protein
VGEAPNLSQARRLHERGVAQNLAGHPLLAVRTLRRALALCSGAEPASERAARILTARIWISMATSVSELNGLDPGLQTLARAQQVADELAEPGLDVVVHGEMGYMKVRGGHVEDGLRHLDRAVELLAHADPDNQHAILLNRGTTHLFRGDLARARTDLTGAVQLAERHGLPIEGVKARHNLGYLEFLSGNLALALRTMHEVLAVPAEFSRAVVLLDRSRVLFEAGLHREADESLVEAERLFRADRLWKDVAEVELARAECAMIDGQIPAARRLAASARTRFRRRANDRWRRDAELVLITADLAAGRPGGLLARVALRLAAEFRADGLSSRARTAQLLAAEALLRSGSPEQARQVAAVAGPVRADDPISARLQTRLVRARLALASGGAALARREIRTGLTELARHQSRFGSLDLQTASAVHGRQLTALDLDLALAGSNPVTLLASIERGRAISSRLPPVLAVADPAVAELLAELRMLGEELRVIESDATAARRVAAQRRRIAEIQRQLRTRAWQLEGTGSAREPVTLAVLQASVAEAGCVFVSVVESAGRLHAQLVDDGRPRTVPLAAAHRVGELWLRVRADLNALAMGRLPEPLRVAVAASLARSLGLLDELLIRPLGMADQRLVIAPTGELTMLPWNLLPSLRGRPVVVAPSATAWIAAQVPPTTRARSSVAPIAGPDLARAADEVEQIGRIWGDRAAEVTVKGRPEDLVRVLAECSVVHVAAHGEHQAENPLFSSIRLADGSVFAYELEQRPLAAEHVVLSACELGQATIRPGDEALGLTSVLLHLGSRSVISGVARVHDEVAAEVMVGYHRSLAAGMDSARALAESCARTGAIPAPFVCFGAAWSAV